MKKVLAIIMAVSVCVCFFAGCSSKSEDKSGKSGNAEVTEPAVKTETFDAGNVKAEVPEGWKAFAAPDLLTDDPDDLDPDVIRIIKGGKTDTDLLTKPYIQINYYGPDTVMMKVDKELYDEPQDLEPVKAGDLVWEGYQAKSLGYGIIILYCEDGDNKYQANFSLSNGSINVTDKDVLAILSSVKPSK